MRKFFTLIGAALLSLTTLHATAVTEDISLASFEVYQDEGVPHGSFDPSTLAFSEIKAWGGGQLWYSDQNADALDAEDFTHIGLDLAEAAANKVRIEVQYTTADGGETQNVVLDAGETSKLLALNGRYIKKIEIKNWSSADGASFTMSKLYFFKAIGKEETHNLFTGTHDVGSWTWSQRLIIAKENFAAVHEGDKITITYTSGANGQCGVRIKSDVYFTESGQYAPIEQSQTDAEYSFVIREADIASLQANGMYITGTSLTISKVDLATYSQQVLVENVLHTGNELLDWGGGIWEHTTDLPTLAAGDELRVILSELDDSGNYQVYLKYGWGDGEYVQITGIDGTVPKAYSVALSAEQATAINAAGKLFVYGTGVKVSHFAVAQPMSIYDADMLFHGEAVVTSWASPVDFVASKFADLTVGDKICIALTDLSSSGQFWVMTQNYIQFTPQLKTHFNSTFVAPMTLSYTVNQDMLDALKANGMRISGANFTIGDIYILRATAHTESYTLSVSSAGMATLVLPFNVPELPAGVEAYSLTNDGSEVIEASSISAIQADQPVLIIASEGEYEFVSEPGANAGINGKYSIPTDLYQSGALKGNYHDAYVPKSSGTTNNYVLQNHGGNVAFYQVVDANTCTVAPYRAYLSCSYDASATWGGGAPAPMRMVFRPKVPTAVESSQQSAISSQKLLRDGQLYIIRDNTTYNAQGQLVK